MVSTPMLNYSVCVTSYMVYGDFVSNSRKYSNTHAPQNSEIQNQPSNISAPMASPAAAPPAAFSLRMGCKSRIREFKARDCVRIRRNMHGNFRVYAMQGSNSRQKAPLGVEMRIHRENENEVWLGESNSQSKIKQFKDEENLLKEKFSDLLNSSSDSYYQSSYKCRFGREKKKKATAANRRLSKECHPDTTELPLKAASEKFMKLREICSILSNVVTCSGGSELHK